MLFWFRLKRNGGAQNHPQEGISEWRYGAPGHVLPAWRVCPRVLPDTVCEVLRRMRVVSVEGPDCAMHMQNLVVYYDVHIVVHINTISCLHSTKHEDRVSLKDSPSCCQGLCRRLLDALP